MTQKELEAKYTEVFDKYGCGGFETLSEEELNILLAYEHWQDGADWNGFVQEILNHKAFDKSHGINTLCNVFGYSPDDYTEEEVA